MGGVVCSIARSGVNGQRSPPDGPEATDVSLGSQKSGIWRLAGSPCGVERFPVLPTGEGPTGSVGT